MDIIFHICFYAFNVGNPINSYRPGPRKSGIWRWQLSSILNPSYTSVPIKHMVWQTSNSPLNLTALTAPCLESMVFKHLKLNSALSMIRNCQIRTFSRLGLQPPNCNDTHNQHYSTLILYCHNNTAYLSIFKTTKAIILFCFKLYFKYTKSFYSFLLTVPEMPFIISSFNIYKRKGHRQSKIVIWNTDC